MSRNDPIKCGGRRAKANGLGRIFQAKWIASRRPGRKRKHDTEGNRKKFIRKLRAQHERVSSMRWEGSQSWKVI